MWTVCIGTLFPNLFPGPLGISCIGKGLKKVWDLEIDDLRSFALDSHKTVDDTPFGGGGGMLIKCDIIDSWFGQAKNFTRRKIYVSPRGKAFSQDMVNDLLREDICILCGRYEGVDVRVLQHWDVEELSLGDFILHGGEVAAMALVEACARALTVKDYSFNNDTFSHGLLECDQYTKPEIWSSKYNSIIPGKLGMDESKKLVYPVPKVLMSGHHKEIREWRQANSAELTKNQRPDLWQRYLEGKK